MLTEIEEKRLRDALKGFISSHLDKIQRNNDLEDLVQETLLKVCERIHTYDPARGSFYSWLLIWARYVLMRYFEEKRRYLDKIIIMSEIEIKYKNGEIDENTYNELTTSTTVWSPRDPQEISEMLEKFYCFLCIAFGEKGGYPHQQIAFGYIKLLEWKPQEIVRELSEKSLRKLAKDLENEYVEILKYADEEKVRKCFKPLHQRIEKKLEEVIPTRDRGIITISLSTIIGDTKLSDYWGNRPEDNLSNWCYRVRQRVIEEIRKRKIDC